jgi:TonB family protein
MRFEPTTVGNHARHRGTLDTDVVVLTDAEQLHSALKETVGPEQRVWRVPTADQVADLLTAGRVGVLVIDTESLPRGAPELITQLNMEFPDLVVVVAGTHDEAPQFARLLGEGLVYRFLQMPLSTARVRAFIEAAIRRHRELIAEGPTAVLARKRTQIPRLVPWAVILAGVTVAVGVRLATSRQDVAQAPSHLISMPGSQRPGTRETPLAAAASSARAPGQTADERERQLLDPARAAAKREELASDQAAIDHAAEAARARPTGGRAPPPIANPDVAVPGPAAQIGRLLREAQTAVAAGNLVQPASGSAKDLIGAALKLDPQNAAANRALTDLQTQVVALARASLVKSDTAAASAWIGEAQQLGVGESDVIALRRAQTETEQRSRAERLSGLARLAAQRLADDRLIEPADDSARQYIRQLQSEDPALAVPLSQQLSDRLLAKAQRELSEGRLDGAAQWLKVAEESGVIGPQLAALRADLQVARAHAAFLANVVPVSTLKNVKYVPPIYPRKALNQNLEGWVYLEFTVDAGGATRDIVVKNTVPTGVFEQSAVDALAKWHFQPVQRDGKAVDQRAGVRVQFKLAQ